MDPSSLSPASLYRILTALIAPRPIAWVSTVSPAGKANLAPFSFFNAVGANPPTLAFSPVNRRDGSKKDTLRNIEATGEFVVNIPDFALAEAMNRTSAELAYGESEFDFAGIAAVPSEVVKPWGVAAAPARFECRLHSVLTLGAGPLGAHLVVGSIVRIAVHPSLLDAEGKVRGERLDAIGRLGGDDYVRTTDRFGLSRP